MSNWTQSYAGPVGECIPMGLSTDEITQSLASHLPEVNTHPLNELSIITSRNQLMGSPRTLMCPEITAETTPSVFGMKHLTYTSDECFTLPTTWSKNPGIATTDCTDDTATQHHLQECNPEVRARNINWYLLNLSWKRPKACLRTRFSAYHVLLSCHLFPKEEENVHSHLRPKSDA